ncbi:MAG: thiol peroxidase [Candidatus Sericytochromatia bacterium]
MAEITLRGNKIHTVGDLPSVGDNAPDFRLTKVDLSDVSLNDFRGKKVILNIFPSVDTPICSASVRKFNEELSKLDNTVVLCVSKDLPFALKRFCGAEGLENVIPLSELRDQNFATDYGVRITEGGMAGLMSRAVVALNEHGEVIYTEQVPEIAQEPDYNKVVEALNK